MSVIIKDYAGILQSRQTIHCRLMDCRVKLCKMLDCRYRTACDITLIQ
ncbi:MAG TPA: hypothetical protein VIO11_01600 [Candidatus Methanoperedens sp.]